MGELDIAPHFGAELKDAFKPVNAWVAGGIAWLEDIQQFYRERSTIEKEYSAKLTALAKRYYEKKSRKSSALNVGDTPTLTPGSLESASLTTWTTQLSMIEARANEHEKFSVELVAKLAEPLRHVTTQFEEMRKKHAEYASKLEQERDSTYSDLGKIKSKYDGTCAELESRRKKAQGAFDHGKSKAQSAYHQQTLDMHNAKNVYLIQIRATNKQKGLYYHSYIPELLDSLQDLSELRTAKLNSIWTEATKMESAMLLQSNSHVDHLATEITRNNPLLDSMMFVRHNTSEWQEPPDKGFEPSPVWHDDDALIVDDNAKVFLRNILSKSKGSLSELKRDTEAKRREVENMRRLRDRIRSGKEAKDEVEVIRAILQLQDQLHESERKRSMAEIEIDTITNAVGDVTIGGRDHNFKAQTFKIPTNCDLCGDRIWGLSAKGYDCKDCGYTCHSKCELKVPGDCPGEQSKEERKKLKTERQEAANAHHQLSADTPGKVAELPAMSRSTTMNSLSSGYSATANRSVTTPGTSTEEPKAAESAAPAVAVKSKPVIGRKNRIVAPPPAQYVSELPANGNSEASKPKHSENHGKMMYAYQANSPEEVSVDEGVNVVVLEPDENRLTIVLDGGWTKVRVGHEEGLVPTSYVKAIAAPVSTERPSSTYSNSSASLAGSTGVAAVVAAAMKKKGPAVAPKRGAKKLKYVEALYPYEAQSEAEWSMQEGERFVLVSADSGDGWAEVERGGVTKSVPANYVQDVS